MISRACKFLTSNLSTSKWGFSPATTSVLNSLVLQHMQPASTNTQVAKPFALGKFAQPCSCWIAWHGCSSVSHACLQPWFLYGQQFRCSCELQGTVNLIIAQNRLAKLAAAKEQGLAPASSNATADSDEINQMEEASRSDPSLPSCCQQNGRAANANSIVPNDPQAIGACHTAA